MAYNVKVPMYKVGKECNHGFIPTKQALMSIIDTFYSIQKKIPCYNKGEQIGEVYNIEFCEDTEILYFHVSLDKQYSHLKSELKTYCEVSRIDVL